MEEVDKIILDSLKNLDCDIDPEIEHLKQFDADLVAYAVASCLEAILQNGTLPKKLPPSMSARLKFASNLAEQIKDLGFRGDMGYQTILYCNEEEVRRMLMFLIERLPKETAKNIPIEQAGYVPRIVKSLEENIKLSLSKPWLPSCFLRQGARETSNRYLIHSMSSSCPLRTQKLDIPSSKTQNEDLKDYWIHLTPDVTKQCSPRKLIPSLLFQDNDISDDIDLKKVIKKSEAVSLDNLKSEVSSLSLISDKLTPTSTEKEIALSENDVNAETSEQYLIEKLSKEVESMKSEYVELQEDVKNAELKLVEIVRVTNEKQDHLKETLAKVKLKSKTATVLSKEENLAKLNNMIKNSNDRLVELAKQWEEIQRPLLEEYRSLKNNLTSEESKFQEQKEKLDGLKDVDVKLHEDLREKKMLSQNLLQQYQQLNRSNNRAMYTSRILEIIGNINKQNNDIWKVLKDTRQIQKEIKNLTGQVDRSFTLADELIFYDAKHDETARRSYKLLAALRDEFGSILKTLEDLGVVERECRNLEEQIESEKVKEIAIKLDRVYSDIKQIQKETQMLKEQAQS
ncbi:coiled-coil domain-containing protein 22 [Diabrotica virgifera virgifera]|uniref:Coiled-coil domain-containing protein 22 homolog n=1 Tax=Diabrotica virgifera virgifera TaxID=50390 RepID=A0ABM5KA92_DIAVI|nr:coiled-coil domain-containing protein 22 [Diabrotica virgifera virgifera]